MKQGSFLWGAATSSHQIEGYNDKNDWWAWENAGNIEGGARSGAATDHWNLFREDLKMAADLGLNSYRFSVEWSRLEPEEGKWDRSALHWYRELIAECEKRGLLPMLTLHHFTLPKWFADKGGFAWEKAPEKFAEYVKFVVTNLGSRVPLWCTLNEPMVLLIGGYLGKFMPPAKFDPKLAGIACANMLRCHVAAYDLIHALIQNREGPWRDHPIEVGIAHNMLDFRPDREWHPIELALSGLLRRFYNRAWLDAITGSRQHFGILGLVPAPKPVREALSRKTADYIGINYYTKAYVKWRPRDNAEGMSKEMPVGIAFARRKAEASDLGWAVHPRGLGRMLRFVRRYELPVYITENGIADREDRLRPDYLVSHLQQVAEAIENGMDIRGYYHWSLIDNFEWVKGFGPRFGLFEVDYDSFARKPRRSAELYRKIIAAHREEGEFKRPATSKLIF